jgi:hypothetical protein
VTRIVEWTLLAILGWRARDTRPAIALVGCSLLLHFALFPFCEDRYFVLLYMVGITAVLCASRSGFVPQVGSRIGRTSVAAREAVLASTAP